MINKDGGGGGQFLDFIGGNTAVMRGDTELMGPPLGKTLIIVEYGHTLPNTFKIYKSSVSPVYMLLYIDSSQVDLTKLNSLSITLFS